MTTADPRVSRLTANVADLMQQLARSAHSPDDKDGLPDEKTVHRLRTGTRRAGALLDSLLQSPGRSRRFATRRKPAEKLLRQWKKLRRAAGSVRDLDVHRTLVKKLQRSLKLEAPGGDEQPRILLLKQQLEELDKWLAAERDVCAKQLQAEAAKRQPRCVELTKLLLDGLPAVNDATPPPPSMAPAKLALEDFYRVSEGTPALDRANLHDFRKQTKEARYVAEAGGQDEHAVAVGAALKRIQDAIGDWHDLDALMAEAAQAEGNAASRELREQLHYEAERKLERALAATERMRRKLLGERLALKQPCRSTTPRT
jgi:CHAD domain-containing protein